MEFSRVEPPYTSKGGSRLVWRGVDEDDENVFILNKREFDQLLDFLKKDSTGKIELEDHVTTILVNSDTTQFNFRGHGILEVKTPLLRKYLLEYAKAPHEPQKVQFSSREFYHRYESETGDPVSITPRRSLLQTTLSSELEQSQVDTFKPDLFEVIATRRSTRRFDKYKVEEWKVDEILAAADTAPTAGNFQGFQVFYVKNKKVKSALVEAANNQQYVNAPVVLVFLTEPVRIKLKFQASILEKFALQDATLAASYAQLAAHGLGLSSIWIGMIDEEKVKSILETDLRPSSILCIGYPYKKRPPKSKRKLKELIKIIE
jgi:nitroreductase